MELSYCYCQRVLTAARPDQAGILIVLPDQDPRGHVFLGFIEVLRLLRLLRLARWVQVRPSCMHLSIASRMGESDRCVTPTGSAANEHGRSAGQAPAWPAPCHAGLYDQHPVSACGMGSAADLHWSRGVYYLC